MAKELMRLFVYTACFTGVVGVILQPSPTANIQRFKSLVLNCSLGKSWTNVAFNLETVNIAFLFNTRFEPCMNYARPPRGSYHYETNCDFDSSTFYLTIHNVTDSLDGKFIECRCTCEDEVGSARTTINVQYPPTSFPSITQIPSGPVIESNKITLVCTISSGKPLATIVWQCIGFTQTTQTGNNVTVSVIERVVTKDDNGKECRCIIKHPLLDADKEVRSTLNVHFGPKSISLSPASYLYVVSEDKDINKIICTAICSPDCNYTWTGPNGFREHHFSLELNSVNRNQTGLYICHAKNDYGSKTSDSINIIVNYPPDQPTDIFVACEITSIIVSWRSGSNGGIQQKFRVAWLNIRTQNTKYSPKIMDSGQGQTIQYIIQSLEPSTLYIIYVEATNKQGVVRSENNANCTTRSSLSQSNNTVATSVGASIGSSMLILIIAVLVFLFLRRRPCNKEENSKLYQSTYPDTSRRKTNIDQHTYDELQTIKTGSSTEYEEANSVSTYEEIGIANPGSYYQNANKDNEESIQRHETSTVYANTKT